ncbi:MAG: hypothetical protein ABR583_09595 [Gaiellaceae bacterium]
MRRRDLTPLTGELRARQDWRAPEPDSRRRFRRRRREKAPPKTWREAIARGLLRFTFLLTLLAGVALLGGIGLAATERFTAERGVPLGFYLLGTLMIGGALLRSGGSLGAEEYYESRAERESAVSSSFVYVAFGVSLIVIGVVIDTAGVI